jgi:uncharacterized membrane protein
MNGAEPLVLQAQLLPSGFELPPTPYLAGIGMATLIVSVLMVVFRLEVTGEVVLGLGVWMAIGATLHASHQIGAFPPWASPLFGAPAVYFTTFVVAGLLWIGISLAVAAEVLSSTGRLLGIVGLGVWILLLVFFVVNAPALLPFWPTAGLFATVVVGAAAYIALALIATDAVAATGRVGAFVVFSHTLDGISTAIGVDVLNVGEQTPLPRLIMDVAADLPTATYIGTGWLFVLTKIVLAMIIVVVFADYVEESESRGNIAMAAIAAVGFGPGVYNLLLFLVSQSPT